MPVVSLTKRQIKNVKTGTDITVPSYQKASSPRNVKDYHVVIISTLPHFKKPEHSEDDVIQFMVPRDYNAFEKLQKELLEQFTDLKLPDLPRKHILFMSDEDLEDRRVSFDCLMIIVSRSVELTTSIPMLEFLGIDLLADRKYKKRRAEYLEEIERKKEGEGDEDLFSETSTSKHTSTGTVKDTAASSSKEGEGEVSLFEEDDEDSLLFGSSKDKETVIMTSDRGLFDDEPSSTTSSSRTQRNVKLSLLEDEPELTILKTGTSNGNNQDDPLFAEEDNSELLQVSDTLDDALKVAKDKKPKPKKKPAHLTNKPPVKSSLASSLFDDDMVSSTTNTTDAMGTDDITKYIQQNQVNSDDDDLQLF